VSTPEVELRGSSTPSDPPGLIFRDEPTAVETVQFKYSVARADVLCAPLISETLAKFATTERDAHPLLEQNGRWRL
jgi:hypothetical protein